MRRSDTGKGTLKAIISLLFLAVVVFCGFKIIPVYVSSYEFNDDIRQLAIQATVDHSSAEGVQNRVLEYAKGLGLPVTRKDVVVHVDGSVSISVDYTVPVDLKIYTWPMHFTPSTENKAIG